MSGSICLRCLARPVAAIETSVPTSRIATAAFSTSAPLSANPPKKKGPAVAVKKQQHTKSFTKARAGGKGGSGGGRPPQQGERKAMRKRIVLSNTNALEVHGLEDMTAKNMVDSQSAGKMLGLSNEVLDALRAAAAFKPTQGWSLFRRPATLVRKETLDVVRQLEEAGDKKSTVRKVIFGEKGSGKSVLQLQAMAAALLKGWVVIHIPEAQELSIGHTSYQPVKIGEETVYVQPHYIAQLLGQIAKANYTVLSTLRLSKQHNLPIPVQSNISLVRFAELGAGDADIAWPFFTALWSELTAPSAEGEGMARPPVLLTLDSLNFAMGNTAYLNAELQNIHAHDLALVRQYMNILSGAESLPNGGAVIAATTESNKPASPALDFACERNEALQAGKEVPEWDPYVKVDRRVLKVMEGAEALHLKGLSKDEARGVMEYYARSGMLRQTVNDSLVGEKWTLSGGGIIGELERSSVVMRV